MSTMPRTNQDIAGRITALEAALAEEGQRYTALLELASAQIGHMTGADLDAIAGNAAAMATGLAQADGLRQRREQLASDLMEASGQPSPGRLSAWLEDQAPDVRARLGHQVAAVRRAGERLLRQNEKNRRLASFCLDLVEEEAQVLRRSLLHDSTGCYDRGAQPTHEGGGRMLQKKA